MDDWQMRSLADIVELRRGFDLPTRQRDSGAYPVLSAGATAGWHSEGPVKGPGFVVGRATNLGVPTWCETDFWPLNTTLYAADFKGNVPRYLFHLFESLDLSGYDSGSVQPMLNRNYIADIKVRIAPVPTQRAIAEVLGALDDKIAANDRILTALSQLGEALFTQALVDGEPLGVRLDEVAVHRPGKYLAKTDYAEGGPFAVYGSNSLMGWHSEYMHEGAFTVLARIGSYCGALRWSQRPAWVNNNASAVLPREGTDPWILGHALSRVDMNPHRGGSGQPFIRVDSLMSAHVVLPSPLAQKRTAPLLRNFAERAVLASDESQQLATTRDELLPLLMSGKVRVRDAEKIVEEAV